MDFDDQLELEHLLFTERKCRVCGEEINNINSCPEKMYAGKNTCRTGMASSELLPESPLHEKIKRVSTSNKVFVFELFIIILKERSQVIY